MKLLATNVVYCERCRIVYELEKDDFKKVYGYLYRRIKCPHCGHEIAL